MVQLFKILYLIVAWAFLLITLQFIGRLNLGLYLSAFLIIFLGSGMLGYLVKLEPPSTEILRLVSWPKLYIDEVIYLSAPLLVGFLSIVGWHQFFEWLSESTIPYPNLIIKYCIPGVLGWVLGLFLPLQRWS